MLLSHEQKQATVRSEAQDLVKHPEAFNFKSQASGWQCKLKNAGHCHAEYVNSVSAQTQRSIKDTEDADAKLPGEANRSTFSDPAIIVDQIYW